MHSRPDLKLDWCSHAAAKFAVERWHYSARLPAGKIVKIGVWEGGQFIGVVLFGLGSGNTTNGRRYGLAVSHEIAELTRVALRTHNAPVSRIVAIAIRMIKRQSPGIRLLISMADPGVGHVGGIYQAMNWIYTGTSAPDVQYFSHGKWEHHRTATSRGSVKGLPSRRIPPKHRYLYPLDAATRQQIEPLRKPYPKKCAASIAVDAPGVQPGEDGAAPIAALQDIPATAPAQPERADDAVHAQQVN